MPDRSTHEFIDGHGLQMNDSSQQYTVLARRCRPQSFDEVVGQEHVGQAIQNAIRTGRVAHAYLFTGARGVGKTSTARIFAKALNCPNAVDGIPCNRCEICEGIGAGNDVDVLEIDGASNRGIDDIRQLRANVSVRSMRSPYKVYIIDEVHMLTKEAFNALLKTLEEPPPNVKFVFCTTEPNKVPDTILSRCQRFDFGTIAQASIAQRLKQISIAEGKQVDDDAIELVARRAAGSMRDSQSLFDQLLAFGGERITSADVHRLLGTASDDRLIQLVEALISNQPAAALQQIESSLSEGVQVGSLSDQLMGYLRDLLVTAAGAGEVALSAVSENSRPQVQDQAKRWGLLTISAAMQILAEAKSKMQRATYARALFELALVRMATLEQLEQIAALIQRGGVALPAAAPVAAAPSSGGNLSATVKKNVELTPPSLPPVASPPDSPAPSTASPSEVETAVLESSLPSETEAHQNDTPQESTQKQLTNETLNSIWGEAIQLLPERHQHQLKYASKIAISGPNRLEILFPKSYAFSRSFCERPDSCKRLVEALRQVCGETLDCRIGVDESAPVASTPAPAVAPRRQQIERRKTSVVDGDPFVQVAVEIFGGKVEEVRPLFVEIVESPVSEEEGDMAEPEFDDDSE